MLDTVADAFLARFKAALEALKPGDPMEEKTTLGPLNLDWTDAGLPFGGVKHSGYGRELGRMGIQEFVNKKLVRSGRMAAPI